MGKRTRPQYNGAGDNSKDRRKRREISVILFMLGGNYGQKEYQLHLAGNSQEV
jgi:hypothetical protein